MIMLSWFALSRSYASTVKREKVTDFARFALERMESEIRDAEQPPDTVSEARIVRARPYYIVLYTTFNKAGNDFPDVTPAGLGHVPSLSRRPAVALLRQEQQRQIAGIDESAESDFNLNERSNGEGAQILVDNVVNGTPSTPPARTPCRPHPSSRTSTTSPAVHGGRHHSVRRPARHCEPHPDPRRRDQPAVRHEPGQVACLHCTCGRLRSCATRGDADGHPAQVSDRCAATGRERERGAGLVLIIGVVAALAISAASLIVLTANVQSNTADTRQHVKSFTVCEAGLDSGMALLAYSWPMTSTSIPDLRRGGLPQPLQRRASFPTRAPGGSSRSSGTTTRPRSTRASTMTRTATATALWMVSQARSATVPRRVVSQVERSVHARWRFLAASRSGRAAT